MTYHLFQRTITKNGKKIKAWYYWFYDSNGKQVRKSCGQNGKPCLLKRDAESFIENLQSSFIITNRIITFNNYCKDFYNPNSKFIQKQIARGYKYQNNTLYQKNLYLSRFLDAFGNCDVTQIAIGDVENWLVTLPYCNSVKNSIITIIEEIEDELYADRLINYTLRIKHFKRNTQDKGVLSLAEINSLFPDNYEALINVWRIRATEREKDIFSFAVMIYTILSTGMRSSEIRALQWNQFVRPDAILINAMIDSNDERVNRLKKWTDENKKWRVTVLPDKTVRLIDLLRLDKDDDYVFTYENKPVKTWFLLDHFKCVLRKNKIDCDGRNITIHSLRFTYNTMLNREISGQDLRLMVGHVSEKMTEYYDKSKALEHLDELLLNKNTLNNVFS